MCLIGLVISHHISVVIIIVDTVTVCGCKSIIQPFLDRKLMVSSLLRHQISTSFLVGKLVGSVYCSMKTFVTFSRNSSRFCESCVGLPTWLYTGTLNSFGNILISIDHTSFLCVNTFRRRRSCQTLVTWCHLPEQLVYHFMCSF